MEAALFIWFASVVGNLQKLLFITGGFVLALFAAITIGTAIHRDIYGSASEPWPIYKKVWKITVAAGLILLLVAGLIPNQKTMYLMAGGYLGQNVLMSDTAKRMKDIVDTYLDEQLSELTKQK